MATLRLPSMFEPRWYRDEGIFAAIAQALREGQGLYGDAWDNKPPFIFLTYAAIQETLGGSVLMLHLVTTVVVLITQLLLFLLARQLLGLRRATVAAILFALVMGTPVIEGNLALTETYMILPTTLAMLLYVSASRPASTRRLVACGAALGVAAGYKQVAVFDAAALAVVVALIEPRTRRALAALAGGWLAVQVGIAAAFLAAGSFSDYWYAVAGSLGAYSDRAPAVHPAERALFLAPAAVVCAGLALRRQRGGVVTPRDLPLVWLAFAVAGATASGFTFPHYLQQAAPGAAITLASIELRAPTPRRLAQVLAVGLVAAAVAVQFGTVLRDRDQVQVARYYRAFFAHPFERGENADYELRFDGGAVAVRDIATLLRQDAADGALFSWSEFPWLYTASGRTNPTRYSTTFLASLHDDAESEMLRDLAREPPAYIVISSNVEMSFPGLDEFVQGRYIELRAAGDWRLYRRAGLAGGLAPNLTAGSPVPP